MTQEQELSTQLPDGLVFKTYMEFPPIASIDEALGWSDEQLDTWNAQACVTAENNKDVYQHNRKVEANWAVLLKKINKKGLSVSKLNELFACLGYNSSSGYYEKVQIRDFLRFRKLTLNGKTDYLDNHRGTLQYFANSHCENYGYLRALINEVKKMNEQYKKQEEQKKEYEVKQLKLTEQFPDIKLSQFSTVEQYFAAIDDAARDAYLKENFPDGTELDFDQCSECNSWTVGYKRCDCGNRRVYLEVDGNAVDGFTAYAMAH